MTAAPLQNYLGTYRQRTGLSQEEAAYLLGAERETTVSRHETFQRLPSLRMALGYELIYGTRIRELFSGVAVEVEADVREHAFELLSTFPHRPVNGLTRLKQESLVRITESEEPIAIPLWDGDL